MRDDEGPWAKLRRRKVVQWGVMYAAGAWGFLQGLAYVSSTFDWPRQIQQLSTLALLVGLPIVVVLAWYHGERGQQQVTRTELAVLTLLFLLGGAVFWRYQSAAVTPGLAPSSSSASAHVAATRDSRPSIAVLPFENRSTLDDDAFFVDGIHDDILTQLTKIGAMKVIARTSVEQFRDTTLSTREIGDKLGVATVLEGGVQRVGDRVRINVQLIDAGTDAHLWAESYDRELSAANIFAIQSEVAAAIAGALNATLTAGEKARVNIVPTRNLAAWEAYQLGKQRMARRTSSALAEAEKFFERAIALDPKFALAHVGLADTLGLMPVYSDMPRDIALARAEKAAETALELDPTLAEAWASSANIAGGQEQYGRAEERFRRAIALNPGYATAFHWLSNLEGSRGRREEGLSLAARSAELDPLSAIINLNLAGFLAGVGRFQEAEERYRKALEIDPAMPLAYTQFGGMEAYALNRFDIAVPLFAKAAELDPDNPENLALLGMVCLDVADDARASQIASSVLQRWPENPVAQVLSALVQLFAGSQAAALKRLPRVLADNPQDYWAQVLLRNADLKAGHPDVARARYLKAYPNLLEQEPPTVDGVNWAAAVDLVPILQQTGEIELAAALLDRSESFIKTIPRLGEWGFGVVDVQIHALRGDRTKALAALREAEKAGWRGQFWRYYRDFDPALASIRNEPEFKAVFADIENDMARQRAELAKRPPGALLDVAAR